MRNDFVHFTDLSLALNEGAGIFRAITVAFCVIFGYIAAFLGGFDSMLIALVTMICADYLTGIVKAVYLKKLSSAIGYKGILKKVLMLIVVGVTVTLSQVLPAALPLREITIVFFICNEAVSVLENAGEIIPLPAKLKNVLNQLKNEKK